jgi:heme exporter protein D
MGARAAGARMNWGSAGEFFAMGGYGVYVWGAYGVTALCIAIELWTLARRARRVRMDRAAAGGTANP